MQIVHGYDFVPANAKGSALAIGNFDGVHRGHQVLLTHARQEGRRLGCPAGVMVFEPHPREFFKPEEPHFTLTPLPQKLRQLDAEGMKVAIVLPFDAGLANLTAEDFIEGVLVRGLGVRHVVIGYDFFFGKARGGNPETMRRAGEKHGFGVSVIEPQAEDGEVFSSSAIRLKLAQGDVRGAAQDLGRAWRVAGRVVGGARRGTGLGYPTANLPMPKGTALGHGIYAVRAHFEGEAHDAAAYLGTRPTFDDGMPVLEVFLIDFDGDLYGKQIEVEFLEFVRGDRKFDSGEDLKAQMERDVAHVRAVLKDA